MSTLSPHIPLSLYVHFPWCIQKCPYCDFNSHTLKEALPEDQYIDALLSDLEADLPLVWGRRISSLFMGGGTPSLFSPEALDRLLAGIRARLPASPGIEITLEANPGTFEQEKFKRFYDIGINRLSIGIQSFNEAALKKLGRVHNGDEAIAAVEMAFLAGFNNVNLDIMHSLPDQKIEDALDDLKTAIHLRPQHISWYQLTIEPNTLFYQQPPKLPNEGTQTHILDTGHALLEASGYNQYEISAYAKDSKYAQHNLNYWTFGDYLGIGAGAHSKLTLLQENQIVRRSKKRHPKAYLDPHQSWLDASHSLSPADRMLEFMMNHCRLKQAFSPQDFEDKTGIEFAALTPKLFQCIEQGLLEEDLTRIKPTEKGHRYLNELLERFVP